MKITNWKSLLLGACFLAAIPAAINAQYSINWHKVAAGGGTSSGASGGSTYSLSGTVGQHDASSAGALTGGGYALTGGFWSLIAAVQSAGAPYLTIKYVPQNSVVVSWPNTPGYTLQQNSDLSKPAGWTASPYPITLANGTNSITISPPSGNLFFRLVNP
jgi:hypothetical protein